ncbi:MAG: hypothetical protein R6U26_03935 [Candidatus Undinarchaeales archaeon]
MNETINEQIGCWEKLKEKSGAVFWQTTHGSFEIIVSSLTTDPGKFGITISQYKQKKFKGKIIGSAKNFKRAINFAEEWMNDHNSIKEVEKWAKSNL